MRIGCHSLFEPGPLLPTRARAPGAACCAQVVPVSPVAPAPPPLPVAPRSAAQRLLPAAIPIKARWAAAGSVWLFYLKWAGRGRQTAGRANCKAPAKLFPNFYLWHYTGQLLTRLRSGLTRDQFAERLARLGSSPCLALPGQAPPWPCPTTPSPSSPDSAQPH